MSRESEFLARLKQTFKAEAEEHRAAILSGLLELEKGELGTQRHEEIVEIVFRAAHSLKGAARAVDMGGIERLCQSMEAIFSAMKKGHRRPDRGTFEALYRALDTVAALQQGAVPDPELEDVLRRLAHAGSAAEEEGESREGTQPEANLAGRPPGDVSPPSGEPHAIPTPPRARAASTATIAMSETVRVPADRLRSIYLRAEELLSVKQRMKRNAADLSELQALQAAWHRDRRQAAAVVRGMRERLADSPPALRFLERVDAHARTLASRLDGMAAAAEADCLHAAERVDALAEEIRSALMLPFSTLLELFPRMVRDLASEEGKAVNWEVRGEDIRIDRRVLEEIKDPLIHLVRNSISHGIEKPEDRQACGKRPAGTVTLAVERAEKDEVQLTLSDDGRGVDLERVKAAAVAGGYLTAAAASASNDQDALELIFVSELSTSPLITEISGRGLGLAIAREKIEAVGGQIAAESTPGGGARFRIRVPLSLATFRGVLVKSLGRTFVVPTANVDRAITVAADAVVLLENRQTVPLDGRAVPLVSLGALLGLAAPEEPVSDPVRFALVLQVSGARIALVVDEVQGEQEILVKNLGRQLARVRNLAGATVLATGEVVPILNPGDLMKSAHLPHAEAPTPAAAGSRVPPKRRILLAEDSVTSRMLLQAILESAGYLVQTAVDGAEAFAALRTSEFDLLVSDVDMPRMNGFDLCRKIRARPGTAELPIVLVTTLGSREDREKGIDAGANAYIAKAGFDRSNLLEVVGRLL